MPIGITASVAALDTDVFVQTGHSQTPQSAAATVEDSNGEIACETRHSKLLTFSETYKIYAATDTDGKVAIEDHIKAGQVKTYATRKFVVTELRLETDFAEKPRLTVGFEELFGDSESNNTYTPPFGRIEPRRKAQAIGIVVGASTNLQRCSATLTLQGLDRTDAATGGSFVTTEAYQGRATAEAEGKSCDTDGSLVADTANDWELEQDLGREQQPKEYGTVTATAFLLVAPDT